MTPATRTHAQNPASDGKPPVEAAVSKALSTQPNATVADLATTTGLGRSTAGKALIRLERSGKVRRSAGGRAGGRRLPDRWTLASEQAAKGSPGAVAAPSAKGSRHAAGGERLKPGELDGLILGQLQKSSGGAVGPTAVAKALRRSSGAVGNALVRLAREEKVQQVSDKPLRYRLVVRPADPSRRMRSEPRPTRSTRRGTIEP